MAERVGVRILEPSLDPNVYDINVTAFAINLAMLYGFGAIAMIVPNLMGVVQRGFFCDDESIRYEYRADTVNDVNLICYNLAINVVSVLAVEYYRMESVETTINVRQYRWRNNHLHVLFVRILTYFGYSQIGFVMNLALNLGTKHVVGRLRPHFLDVCQLSNNTCLLDDVDTHRYITNYTCTGKPEQVLEARKSFYSGHAAISLYCAVWSALYIQARLSNVLNNRVIVPILQTCLVFVGCGIGYSRITDNKHHWSDVLVGFVIGGLMAIYTCVVWTRMFKNNTMEEEVQPLVVRNEPATTETAQLVGRH